MKFYFCFYLIYLNVLKISLISNSCFLSKVPRNYSPSAHPMEEAREYKRALNAVKLEKVFAKPFLASLDGHRDGVSR